MPSRATSVRALRAFAALFLLVAGAACQRGTPAPAPPHLPVHLLGADVSPVAVLTSEEVLDTRVLRLDDPETLRGIGFVDVEHRVTPQGLRVEPSGVDPYLLVHPGGRFNIIDLDLQAYTDGFLEVSWADDTQPFAQERKKRVPLTRAPSSKRYTIDLWNELNVVAHTYRFRLAFTPRAPVTVRSLSFRRVTYMPSASARGRIALGGDAREATALRAGQRLSVSLDIHDDDVLTLALATPRDNDTPVSFQVLIERPWSRDQVAWEERLPVPGPPSWSERRVPLGRFAGRNRRVVLRARAADGAKGREGAAVVLCAMPMVSAARARHAPNVILISLDTLGARHLSLYGGGRHTDPFLRQLATEGALFQNAFATSSVTDASHGSLLTGMAPFNSTSFWLEGTGTAPATLAELLRKENYVTAGFTAGILVSTRQGFDRGFHLFQEEDTLFRPVLARTDIATMLSRAERWWAGTPGPRFLFLHSYEIHGPYYWRDGFFPRPPGRGADDARDYLSLVQMRGRRGVGPAGVPQYVLGLAPDGREVTLREMGSRSFDVQSAATLYESEIAFVDEQLRQFWGRLFAQGLLDNTLVVVTADHGEAFFEHGLAEHAQLYVENLHVPLLLWGPRIVPAGAVVPDEVSSMDVVPTVVDLLGLPAPPGPFDGRSLHRLLRQQGPPPPAAYYAFVRENGFAFHGGGMKYILPASPMQENFGRAELFDLRADPAESRNLLTGGRAVPDSIAEQVARTTAAMPGLHVGLEEFAGGEYELLTNMDPYRLYGFDVERVALPRLTSAGGQALRIRPKPGSRLVALGGSGQAPVVFALQAVGADAVARFAVHERLLSSQPTRVTAAGTTKALWVHTVSARGRTATHQPVTPEEWEKLRALGYAR